MSARIKYTIGQRIGNVIIQSRYGSAGNGLTTWWCLCDCGKERVISSSNFAYKNGLAVSCGCMRYKDHPCRTHGQSGTIEHQVLLSAKSTAKKRGLEFNLTLETLPSIPFECPVLGTPLFKTPHSNPENKPSLDRIDPALGYIPGNVRWISWRANNLRSNGTAKEFAALLADALSIEGREQI